MSKERILKCAYRIQVRKAGWEIGFGIQCMQNCILSYWVKVSILPPFHLCYPSLYSADFPAADSKKKKKG